MQFCEYLSLRLRLVEVQFWFSGMGAARVSKQRKYSWALPLPLSTLLIKFSTKPLVNSSVTYEAEAIPMAKSFSDFLRKENLLKLNSRKTICVTWSTSIISSEFFYSGYYSNNWIHLRKCFPFQFFHISLHVFLCFQAWFLHVRNDFCGRFLAKKI